MAKMDVSGLLSKVDDPNVAAALNGVNTNCVVRAGDMVLIGGALQELQAAVEGNAGWIEGFGNGGRYVFRYPGVDSGHEGVSLSMGGASAYGYESVAFGVCSIAGSQEGASNEKGCNLAMGQYAIADGGQCLSVGFYTVASGKQSQAFGGYSQALGEMALAAGNTCVASGAYAVAMGSRCEASGAGAFAMGGYAKGKAVCSVAMGSYAEATADYAVAMGSHTKAVSPCAMAVGDTTMAGAYNAFAAGQQTVAKSVNGAAFGEHTRTPMRASLVCGRWNPFDKFALFMVGNGSGENDRKSPFYVLESGETMMLDSTSGEMMGFSQLVARVKALEERLAALEAVGA